MNETICIFSAQYLPHMGGVENYTARISQELASRGLHVIVISNNTEHAPEHESNGDIEVFRLPCLNLMNGRYPLPKRNASHRTLWRTLEQTDVSHVAVNTRFYPLSHLGIKYAHARGITPVVIEHGSAHLTAGNPLADKIVEAVEHAITKVNRSYPADYYAVSKKASEWLNHFHIASKGEIPNSIDAEAYAAQASDRDIPKELAIPENAFVIAFVGRLVKEKGIPLLLEAARKLETSNVQFVLAGDGPLRCTIEAVSSPNVHLAGRLATPDVVALLSQADALCLPSRSEGFSTTLLEAAACSTAIITTNIGGAVEIIPSERFGVILRNGNVDEIVQAILDLRSDSERRVSMARAAQSHVVSQFSWADTATKLLAACRNANPQQRTL